MLKSEISFILKILSIIFIIILFFNLLFIYADNETPEKPKSPYYERFERYSFEKVILLGLADGINPCAFATITFLISSLFYIGAEKKFFISFGLTFCFSSMITYFILSLGVFTFFIKTETYFFLNFLFTLITGIFSLTVAIINFRDMITYEKTKDIKNLVGKLPKAIQVKIHEFIRNYLNLRRCVISGLILGSLITLFEFACSGQYLIPALLYIISTEKIESILKQRAILYIVLYNVCFIIPMITVFFIVYYGVAQKKIASFFRKRVSFIKCVLGIIFLWLSVVLIVSAIGKLG